MKQIKLNSGHMIDIVGSGTNTFGKENNDYYAPITMDTRELMDAIEVGYRHFDTAISYRNEAVVGKAIKESGRGRSEFFITSKIPGEEPYISDVALAVTSSLEKLNVDYIDLYLIHHPWDDNAAMLEMWKTLEGYVEEGVLRSIGVSNFTKEQLDYIIEHGTIKPAVNQIQSHPGHWNDEHVAYCQSVGVDVEAWGPLSRTTLESRDALSEIGKQYNKTWAQVALRYQIERGVIVIPKSHNKTNQALNLEIFDFTLSDADKEAIKAL